MISSTSLTRASRNRHLLSRVLRSKLQKEELEVGKKRDEKDADQKKVKKSRKFLIQLNITRLLVTGKRVFRESLVTVRSNSVSSEVHVAGPGVSTS